MALHDIINYLRANRGKYSQEILIGKLRKVGYPENEIQAALGEATSLDTIAVRPDTAFSIVGFLAGLAVSLVFLAVGTIGVLLLLLATAFGGGSALASPQVRAVFVLTIVFLILPFFLYFRLRKKYPNFAKGARVTLILDGVVMILSTFAYLYYFGSSYF